MLVLARRKMQTLHDWVDGSGVDGGGVERGWGRSAGAKLWPISQSKQTLALSLCFCAFIKDCYGNYIQTGRLNCYGVTQT